MLFGPSSTPSCFQKVMVSVLAAIPAILYLDDIVVHGPTTTVEFHVEQLTRALAEHKLTLSIEKCVFSVLAIEYVDFQLSGGGTTLLQSNVDRPSLSTDQLLRLPPS